MGWFSKDPPREDDEPAPVRLASPEFVSALVEVAEIYERREKDARGRVVGMAEQLSRRTYFNSGELDQGLAEIRAAITGAFNDKATANEIRDWIRDYEYRGRRPPYMAPRPDAPAQPYRGGE